MFRNSKVATRVYCFLTIALLAAGKTWAEDDIVDLDPQGGLSIYDVFRSLVDLLSGLIS